MKKERAKLEDKSLLYTFESLTNSLLRELPQCSVISSDQNILSLSNSKKEILEIELEYYSTLGKHQYSSKHYLNSSPINIEKSLNWMIDFSCERLNQTSIEQIQSFKDRVKQSQENIKTFLTEIGDEVEKNYKRKLDFIQSESLLILGHSFHPYPKAREGFSTEDFKKYSPEYSEGFSVAWAVADEGIIFEKHQENFNSKWIEEIAKECLGDQRVKDLIKENKEIIPIHPWQLNHIRSNQLIEDLERRGKLIFINEDSTVKWFSTSSIRSIYSKDSKYMLKFSMSLRLTNSIRHLQQVEVDRGIQVTDVFETKEGIELQKKWPNFKVLQEPAYAAFKNSNDGTMLESIVSCRLNPFINGTEKSAILLASLNQISPSGASYLDQYTGRDSKDYYTNWFKNFCKNVISPLLDAQANFGIFLGAHQQNIILELDNNGLPISTYFRDCQGTGYSEEGFRKYSPFSNEMALDNGNILTPELGQKIFCYYLIINTAFDTIVHLSKVSPLQEADFLSILNKSLRELRDKGVKDSSCIDYLLKNQYLWVKGNYKCCLKSINENTMDSPTDIYIRMENLIRGGVENE